MTDQEAVIREALGHVEYPAEEFLLPALAALAALVAERDDADKTVTVLLAVLPQLIVEAAEDFRTAYLDGREPDLSDVKIRARLDRIVKDKFPSRASQGEPEASA